MKIRIIAPAPRGARSGNRVTAERWGRLLRELGHVVSVGPEYRDTPCDLLVAIHASKSHHAIQAFRRRAPRGLVAVLLAGTDLYEEGVENPRVRMSMEWATRLLVLQPLARRRVPPSLRGKVRVVRQSARRSRSRPRTRNHTFDICVIGQLRRVKDPMRAAYAARRLPPTSRIRIRHIGAALSADMHRRAIVEMERNPRYEWLGSVPRTRVLHVLTRSRALAVTSRSEGGANVISEAVVHGVPIISSNIEGSVGLLGGNYPAYFPVGDTAALAAVMERVENDPRYVADLQTYLRRLVPEFTPAAERATWRNLIRELQVP